MTTKITVQALRDAPLHPQLFAGETRDYPIEDGRALIAIGLVVAYVPKRAAKTIPERTAAEGAANE